MLQRRRVYADNNAGTMECSESVETRLHLAAARIGNPSSAHEEGRASSAVLEGARRRIGAALGVRDGSVVFTSGATESNRLCILAGLSVASARVAKRLVTTTIEHASVQTLAEQLEATTVGVLSGSGVVDTRALATALEDDDVGMVSIILGHNETGVVQPWDEIGAVVARARRNRERDGPALLLHYDAAQVVGKAPVRLADDLGADALTWTAHKFHGPVGIGGVAFSGPHWQIDTGPLTLRVQVHRGCQEFGLRAGTPDATGAACAAAALAAVQTRGEAGHWRRVRDAASTIPEALRVAGLVADGTVAINGDPARRGTLCNTVHVSFLDGRPGTEIARRLDAEFGVAASTGSACSRSALSVALAAMRVGPTAVRGAVRLSLSQLGDPDADARAISAALVRVARS